MTTMRNAMLAVLFAACGGAEAADLTQSAAIDPSLIAGQWISIEAPEYVGFTITDRGGYAIAHAYTILPDGSAPGAEYEAGTWSTVNSTMSFFLTHTACVDGAGTPFARLKGTYNLVADGSTLVLTGPGFSARFRRSTGGPFLPGRHPGEKWGCYNSIGFTPRAIVEL